MRDRSATYQTLRTQAGSFYEVEVICGNKTYDIHDLFTLKINPKIFDGNGPSIGNAYSAVCEMTLKESSDNWPRMAEFSVRIRLSSADGETLSDWLPMGTYYTDERTQDGRNGKLSIVAYDGMLLYEKSWSDLIPDQSMPAQWPITSKAWLDLMEDVDVLELDSRCVIDNTVPLIGLNLLVINMKDDEGIDKSVVVPNSAETIRDVLKTIAAAHGGNWVITPENKLRLVPFANASGTSDSAIAGLAIAGIAIVGKDGDSWEVPTGMGYDDIRFRVQGLETSPALDAVTGVHLETESGTISEAGDDDGFILQGICNFSDSSGVADLCLDRAEGFVYKPFEAEKAMLDPAAEVGDFVIIHGEAYQIMDMNWNIHTWPVANLSASFEEEVDHEYTVLSEETKQYRKLVKGQEAVVGTFTSFVQTDTEFKISVGQTYETKEDAKDKKADSDKKLDDQDKQFKELAMHYRFTQNGEIIGYDGSPKTIRLANDGIDMMVDDDSVVRITQDEMYAPRKVTIPLSGSLQMGNFLFQPRSSGNMSLLWVGES